MYGWAGIQIQFCLMPVPALCEHTPPPTEAMIDHLENTDIKCVSSISLHIQESQVVSGHWENHLRLCPWPQQTSQTLGPLYFPQQNAMSLRECPGNFEGRDHVVLNF